MRKKFILADQQRSYQFRTRRAHRCLSLARRFLAIFLVGMMVLSSLPVNAWHAGKNFSSTAALGTALKEVKVNRTPPKVAPVAESLSFSASPTDEEITRARVFGVPLLRTDETSGESHSASRAGNGLLRALKSLFKPDLRSPVRENQALAQALVAYSKAPNAEDVSSLTGFLKQYPRSGWRAALLANLGMVYHRTGYHTKALEALEEAWMLTKGGKGKNTKAIANWVAGELAEMHSHLGHEKRLEALFAELEGRGLFGPTTEQVTVAKEAMWRRRENPEMQFRCGPMSLVKIRDHQGLADEPAILSARATPHGMSLKQVAELARRAGMKFQIAKREPGAKLLLPAVMHYKVEHYAAIVERREERGREYYLVQNPLFEKERWVSREALDEETSGYFLVPEGPLPSGWRAVTKEEAATVWGRCNKNKQDLKQTMCYAQKVRPACGTRGMAEYNFHAMLVSLNIMDEPLGYAPPRGPAVRFIMTYNQREASQPSTFSFSNLGPKWTFNWLSYVTYVTDDHGKILTSYSAPVYLRGGGQENYRFGNDPLPSSGGIDYMSRAELVAVSYERNKSAVYERRLPDGSREVFSQSDGTTGRERKVFLTQIIDPAGNAIKLTYDNRMRVVAVTDALGQVTTLAYELPGDPLKITKVTDPFGRSATFSYDSNVPQRLIKITDVIGITSEFTYDDGDFITSLKTPYGTTTFRQGLGSWPDPESDIIPHIKTNRWLEATDPLGETERLEHHFYVPGRYGIPRQPDEYGASLYWDKRAYRAAPGDYTKARLYKWMVINNGDSGAKQYEKHPLESEINYSYPDQLESNERNPELSRQQPNALPIKVTRTLDDGTIQTYQFQYNDRGQVTQFIDPAGRGYSFIYDPNQIDLREAHNDKTNEVLARLEYNNQHLPLTYTDAAGQVTRLNYNPQGQVTSVINPKGETTTFTYDINGYLKSVIGPVAGAVTSFTYDGYGRVQTATDSEDYKVAIEYDALDRPTRITYPDGTFEQITYDRLDATEIKDRLGRVTSATYDALRRLTSVTDPLRRVTRMEWCSCGDLDRLIDPAGNITTWARDVQGRVTSKTLADGTQTRYIYESKTSRLKQVIDARGQVANYQYAIDDNLQRINFTLRPRRPRPTLLSSRDSATGVSNTSFADVRVPTPAVTFTYDPNYDRLVSFQDGTGKTTYSYHLVGRLGALQLAAVDGPLDNDTITYSYDELGRAVGRAINGVASNWTFDALGRVTSEVNPLGRFALTYVGATDRLSTIGYPNGQSTTFSYFDNKGDQRLRQIKHQTSSQGLLSQFDYTYLVTGEIVSLTRQLPQATPAQSVYNFRYDPASQLTGAALSSGSSALANYLYAYDPASNRTSEQTNSATTYSFFNNTNQLVTQWQGNAARQFVYDANGNLTNDGVRRFEWDALDRLTAIVMGSHRTEFSYDGLDRRTRIVEKENGAVVSDKQFVWCGSAICEERIVTGAASVVTKRFFVQGETEVVSGTEVSYLYTREHLGSVQQVTDRSGNVVASYEYDPYGQMTKVSGTKGASFGYADYYVHTPSGLNLTLYRAYDPSLGRWLSRDPIGENGGVNLYGYVRNNPVNLRDPYGLRDVRDYVVALLQTIEQGTVAIRRTGNLVAVYDASLNGQTGSDADGFSRRYLNADAVDAGRHIFWQAELTYKYGCETAEEIGYAHELWAPDPRDSIRDMINNVYGRQIGERVRREFKGRKPTCDEALKRIGELVREAIGQGRFERKPSDPLLKR